MSKITSQRISKFTFLCVWCVYLQRGGGGKERHAPKFLVERCIALQPTMLPMQAQFNSAASLVQIIHLSHFLTSTLPVMEEKFVGREKPHRITTDIVMVF